MSTPLKQLLDEPDHGSSDSEVEIEQLTVGPDDPLRSFLPASFGRQAEACDVADIYARARRIPLPPPPAPKKPTSNSGSDSDSDDDDDDDDDDDGLPVSHSLRIQAHTKAVTSISLDGSGGRMATASHDCSFKLFDFASMSRDHLHAFRAVEPAGAHHVRSATFSPLDGGQSLLVVAATPQAKIFSRDGHETVEFAKGDMYLRDMHHTKGHVAELTAGVWHPTDANLCATASADGTLRIWDVNYRRHHKEIVVHRSRVARGGSGGAGAAAAGAALGTGGGRSRMCSLVWTRPQDGAMTTMLAAAALDGALVVYAGNGPYSRPALEVRDAHEPGSWTGALAFASDGRLLASRGQDQTIKLWDTRRLTAPVATRTAFATSAHHPETAALMFMANNTALLAGDATGCLHELSAATLASQATHDICAPTPLVAANRHARLNQLLVGSASGDVHVLFSPAASQRGAKTVLEAPLRKRHVDDDPGSTTDASALSADAILVPAQQQQQQQQQQQLARRRTGQQARRPHMPASTPWGKSQPDSEHIRRNIALSSMRDEDPREALLKYATLAEQDPIFTGVWRKNQPNPIFAEADQQEDGDDPDGDKARRKRRKP